MSWIVTNVSGGYSAAQLQTLRTELQTDPQGYGYAAFLAVSDWINLATIMDFLRDGATPCPVNNVVGPVITTLANGKTVQNASLPTQQILGAIVPADVTASLTQVQLAIISGFLATDSVQLANPDGTESNAGAWVKMLATAGSNSAKAIKALENRNGSRAEQILNLIGQQPGVVVSQFDLSAAINGTY